MDHENCHHLLDSLSPYVDKELSQELCVEIERHLQGCENCRIVIDTLRMTVELYHESPPPDQVPEDVRQRLYMRLELDEYLKNDRS
jgi:predicted anti-sigma-YlaC factor YlaD